MSGAMSGGMDSAQYLKGARGDEKRSSTASHVLSCFPSTFKWAPSHPGELVPINRALSRSSTPPSASLSPPSTAASPSPTAPPARQRPPCATTTPLPSPSTIDSCLPSSSSPPPSSSPRPSAPTLSASSVSLQHSKSPFTSSSWSHPGLSGWVSAVAVAARGGDVRELVPATQLHESPLLLPQSQLSQLCPQAASFAMNDSLSKRIPTSGLSSSVRHWVCTYYLVHYSCIHPMFHCCLFLLSRIISHVSNSDSPQFHSCHSFGKLETSVVLSSIEPAQVLVPAKLGVQSNRTACQREWKEGHNLNKTRILFVCCPVSFF